ncbi:nitrile hydratase subunit beta [Rubrobacter tropicus]|uniref:Nitrile hydratase subunit beta n=1 Tax=Rubrobacter tropicus TaxID=2653851 RepID=A0A6G8Q6L0_9ACTN|nr:SH3-like domain-containing protein [Rubrobacter tropicus]QIN82115.1 nitrile hydratase subunit beta [Rubrobacter tropicus]
MSGPHDMGGEPAGPVGKEVREPEDWERIADAINAALGKKGLQTTDEHRRAIESLPNYRDLAYYERWASATEKLLVEKGILAKVEIDEKAAEIHHRWDGA